MEEIIMYSIGPVLVFAAVALAPYLKKFLPEEPAPSTKTKEDANKHKETVTTSEEKQNEIEENTHEQRQEADESHTNSSDQEILNRALRSFGGDRPKRTRTTRGGNPNGDSPDRLH